MKIPRDQLVIRSSRSGGPGGQNVNRVKTKVEVRFRLDSADWLSPRARSRLAQLFPRRLSRAGDFVVVSSRYRSRARNLEDCIEKLEGLVSQALRRTPRRIPTAPSARSTERRLQQKKKKARQKKERRWRPDED